MAASQGMSNVASRMLRAVSAEYERSSPALDGAGNAGVKERVASHLARIEAQAGRRLARGTGLLATIGSTAPFVGLFGTVWGNMNSFTGISESQTTSLAVVAPGIAEALLATGIGLVAAIPAVITYNILARGHRPLSHGACRWRRGALTRQPDRRPACRPCGRPANGARK